SSDFTFLSLYNCFSADKEFSWIISLETRGNTPKTGRFVYASIQETPDLNMDQSPWNLLTIIPTTLWRSCFSSKVSVPTMLANTDRKSTRLNSSHVSISHAVFCLKKINR